MALGGVPPGGQRLVRGIHSARGSCTDVSACGVFPLCAVGLEATAFLGLGVLMPKARAWAHGPSCPLGSDCP